MVWLNDPARLNALTSDFMADLTETLRSVSNPSRVIVLSGRGRAFCAGGHLDKEPPPLLSESDINARRVHMRVFREVTTTIRSLPGPMVAPVNGACAGADVSLAPASEGLAAFLEGRAAPFAKDSREESQ